jgi:hypothetical protein
MKFQVRQMGGSSGGRVQIDYPRQSMLDMVARFAILDLHTNRTIRAKPSKDGDAKLEGLRRETDTLASYRTRPSVPS